MPPKTTGTLKKSIPNNLASIEKKMMVMTEKRFALSEVFLLDKPCISDNGNDLRQEDVVDLLNTLHEENEQLKEENTELKNDNKRMVKFIMSKGFSLKDYLEWLNEEVWK